MKRIYKIMRDKKGGGIYRCGSRCILCDVCHCPWRQDIPGFYHEDTA